MKKVVLIGATGFVGSHILYELISRHYEVTAIARNADKVTIQSPQLTISSVDVINTDELTKVFEGNDIIISAFNAGWTNPHIYNDFLRGSRSIEKATEKAGVKRLIVVGGAGSLYINGKQLVDGADFPEKIKPGATAARDYLNEIKKNTNLDWTYVSPAIEMGPGGKTGRTGKYRTNTDNPVFNDKNESVISVDDLAVAIVDEIENQKFIKQRFTVGY